MEDYPRTLADFEARFQSDAARREYLAQLRWPDGFACPRCGGGDCRETARGLLVCAGCSHHAFVKDAVEAGSTVHTDGWDPCKGIEKKGYEHEATPLKGRKGSELLPRVHRAVSLLKRWLMGTHQGAVSREHLDYYLDEFVFRFNRRTSRHRGKLLYRLLQNAVAIDPAPFSTLTKAAGSDREQGGRDGSVECRRAAHPHPATPPRT